MKIEELTIVVCCNKKDFFFAKICIASIRYYYPEIAVELVKDEGNGKFNTNDLVKYFQVKIVDLGIKKMGWSGAKFHYLFKHPIAKKVLILDADIVLIGPFLERLLPVISHYDYVVSGEKELNPSAEWVKNVYFDHAKIHSAYPSYSYPGYFFNAGQVFLTTGVIPLEVLRNFFNPEQFPFWTKMDLFPLVDQSVYNYLLPVLHKEGKLKLKDENYMIWGLSEECMSVSLEGVQNKSLLSGLIHWAGCDRFQFVKKMTRGDILIFFESEYYRKIPIGFLKQIVNRLGGYFKYYYLICLRGSKLTIKSTLKTK